jgi:hypothetical protein
VLASFFVPVEVADGFEARVQLFERIERIRITPAGQTNDFAFVVANVSVCALIN